MWICPARHRTKTSSTARTVSVDLLQGRVIFDTHQLPLKAALAINDGDIIDKVEYPGATGKYLQILMKQGQIFMVQMLDEQTL